MKDVTVVDRRKKEKKTTNDIFLKVLKKNGKNMRNFIIKKELPTLCGLLVSPKR
jgi:hypothetical protein